MWIKGIWTLEWNKILMDICLKHDSHFIWFENDFFWIYHFTKDIAENLEKMRIIESELETTKEESVIQVNLKDDARKQ